MRRLPGVGIFMVLTVLTGLGYHTALAGSPISGARDGVAIQGFDPVAYFTEGKALKGSARFAFEWAGTSWFFTTADNRDVFSAQPQKYAPQYGGHCALSVANGRASKGSGEAWYMHQGRLYLNANKDVQARWMRDMFGNIFRADQHWPGMKARLEAE